MRLVLSTLLVSLLVLPTLAVTAARVLPGDSLTWVILRACAPFAIVPYAFAATVLVTMVVGLHGTGRSVVVSVLVLATSLLLLHTWWFVRPFMVDGPGATSDDAFTVMTANLHLGGADPAAVIAAVDRHDVDVLVLEEITPSALDALDRAGLDHRLKHRAGTTQSNRDGIMVFTAAPLGEITAIDTSSPGFAVEMTTAKGLLRVLAVHPIAPNNGVAQWSRDLDAVVASATASREPTLVAGDFNATLDHPHVQALMRAGYRDASADAGLGWRPTWPSPDNLRLAGVGLPSLFALDHVLIRGPLEATKADTRVVRGTDHRALVTRIAWTDSSDQPEPT